MGATGRALIVATLVIATTLGGPVRRLHAGAEPMEAETIAVRPGATCLEAVAVRRRVAEFVAPSRLEPQARVQVLGDVSDPRAARLVVTVAGHTATREFSAAPPDCGEFVDVVAAGIVLALDDITLGSSPTVVASAPAPASAPAQHVAPMAAPVRSRPQVAVAVLAQFGGAVIRGGAAGAQLRAELGNDIVRARLGAGVLHGGAAPLGRGVVVATMLATALDACVGPRSRTHVAWVGACLGIWVGGTRARAEGYSRGRIAITPYVAPALSVTLEVSISARVRAVAELAGLAPIVRPRFDARAPDGRRLASLDTARLGVLASLGLRFGPLGGRGAMGIPLRGIHPRDAGSAHRTRSGRREL